MKRECSQRLHKQGGQGCVSAILCFSELLNVAEGKKVSE